MYMYIYIYEEILTPKISPKFLCIHLPSLEANPLQHNCSQSGYVTLVN